MNDDVVRFQEQWGFSPTEEWSSLVFVMVFAGQSPFTHSELMSWDEGRRPLCGYILVADPKFGDRMKWKLPGGHKMNAENPLQTAARELAGESGIKVVPEALRYCGSYPVRYPAPHYRVIFSGSITEGDRDWMNGHTEGNEGERPKFFSLNEFWELVREEKVLKVHLQYLEELALVLPPRAQREKAEQKF